MWCSRKHFLLSTDSMYCASMQTSPVSSLSLCPPQLRRSASKILYIDWHSAFSLSSFFPSSFSLEHSVFINRKAVRIKSKTSPSHYKVNRSPNTAERSHQFQLSHIQGYNGSLQRALHLPEASFYSTGLRETVRERSSCIAQWKATHTQRMNTNRCCLLHATN